MDRKQENNILTETVLGCTNKIDNTVALQECEDSLQDLFDAFSDPAYVTDLETGCFLAVNQAALEATGYSYEELFGNSVELLDPRYLAGVTQVQTALLNNPSTTLLTQHRTRTGTLLDVEIHIRKLIFKGRECLIGVARDVSERNRIDAILMESERRFRTLAENLGDILLRVDCFMQYTYVNPLVARYFNVLPSVFEGEQCGSVGIGFDGVPVFTAMLKEAMNTGQPVRREFSIFDDGRSLVFEGVVVPEFSQNEITSVVSSLRDVTKINAERKLQKAVNRDLELAGRVQRSLLPDDLSTEHFEIRTIYEPHRIVSGDFYGFRLFSEKLLRGYVIDVTGHGLATAIQTSAINVLFQDYLIKGLYDPELINELNERMKDYFSEGAFAAVICFEIDLHAMTMSAWSGGINHLWSSLSSNQGVINVPGSILGILDTVDVSTVTRPLQRGDCLYFLTDGLYEMFGEHPIHLGDFPQTVADFRALAINPKRWDDCSGVCIRINSGKFRWELDITSQEELPSIRLRVRSILDGIESQTACLLEIAINEAINNACRSACPVKLRIKLHTNRIIVRVDDSGFGFAGNNYSSDFSLEKESGRGIALMRAFMDKVIYNHQGNSVLLMRRF